MTALSRRRVGAVALALLVVLAPSLACAPEADRSDAPADATTAGPAIEILDARVRILPDVGALYLVAVNRGNSNDRLLSVETPAAGSAMMHATVEENETMKMVGHEDGFEVPSGATLELAPGGKHIMLMDLRSGAADRSSIAVTLRFEHAGSIEIDVPVEAG